VAARNVAATLGAEDAKLKRFRYRTLGVFVDMGRHQAVASTVGIKWRGFPAWFLARTYHLAMIPGAKRRLRLLIDWTVGLLFRRDSSELGQLGHPPELDDAGLEEVSAGGSGEEQAASRE
jgi:NADH dehydrogenase